MENARAEGRSVAYQTRLQQNNGVKGYSLFFAPSPAMRTAYPHLKRLWTIGPTAATCNTMHLVLLSIVPHLRKLFAGLKLVNNKKDEDYFLRKATVALIGRELRSVSTFGAILHYAAVVIDGQAMASAYVERVQSAKDHPGRYGHAATMYGIECILGLGGPCGYVPVGAVAEVVATIEREGLHFVLFNREPFSEDL